MNEICIPVLNVMGDDSVRKGRPAQGAEGGVVSVGGGVTVGGTGVALGSIVLVG